MRKIHRQSTLPTLIIDGVAVTILSTPSNKTIEKIRKTIKEKGLGK